MVKTSLVAAMLVSFISLSCNVMAEPGTAKPLPPGLEKKVQRGETLPPGWQKKLIVGDVLDYEIYRQGHILNRHDGLVTVRIEGKLVRLIENSLEIVEILDSL